MIQYSLSNLRVGQSEMHEQPPIDHSVEVYAGGQPRYGDRIAVQFKPYIHNGFIALQRMHTPILSGKAQLVMCEDVLLAYDRRLAVTLGPRE